MIKLERVANMLLDLESKGFLKEKPNKENYQDFLVDNYNEIFHAVILEEQKIECSLKGCVE